MPRGVDRLEDAADHVARARRIPGADEIDDERVEARRIFGAIEERRNEIGLLVGEARERIEEELEPDVPRRAHDGPLERDVPARERDRIVDARHLIARQGDVTTSILVSAQHTAEVTTVVGEATS